MSARSITARILAAVFVAAVAFVAVSVLIRSFSTQEYWSIGPSEQVKDRSRSGTSSKSTTIRTRIVASQGNSEGSQAGWKHHNKSTRATRSTILS